MLVRGLGRLDVNRDWLFARCREVQSAPDGHLDLWSRGHYKSSIITFGLSIQDILSDAEITVGLFSHTRPIAKAFLAQIKREFETNEQLKADFDDILWADPQKQAPQWSLDGGIIVKRKGNPKECTVEAWGLVDGQPTSKHYHLRVYDDVVTRESVTTPEQIQKTTEAWELSLNLGGGPSRERYIGTRYHLFDTYSTMLERGSVKPRLYPATHNGRMDGRPVFLTEGEWADKKRDMSRSTIAAQLLQNPMADEDAVFKTIWLRSYEVRPRTLNVYILVDPSRGRSAESDNTAMAVIGVSSTGAKFLLDGVRHRMTLSQRWTAMRDLYKRWSRAPGVQNIQVGYERYGAQSDDEYFKEQMDREKFWFSIKELNWPRDGTNSKRERVERLEPDFRNSRFYLPRPVWYDGTPSAWSVDLDSESKTFGDVLKLKVDGPTKAQTKAVETGSGDLIVSAIRRVDQEGQMYDVTLAFIEEFSYFPFGRYKDLIDAASRIYDMEAHPPSVADREKTDPPSFWDN